MPPSNADSAIRRFRHPVSQGSRSLYEGGSSRRSGASDKDQWEDDPPQSPGEAYVPPKDRIYYADWARALAIVLVIFIHCLVNAADASGFDPEMNPESQQKKDGIIKSLVQIGIPMFFYISGMGATFFNTEKKGFGLFLGNKVLRLLVPFVVAIFIFLIPRLYFGQQYEEFTRPDGKVEEDYWTFQQKTLPTIFSKLSWLWYLPALFIDCVLTYPLLAWSIRRAKKIPYNQRDDGNIILLQIALLCVWCYPCFYMDTSMNYGQRYLFPSVLTLSLVLFLFYVFQLLIYQEGGDKYAMWIKVIGPVGSICLNYWKDQAPNMPLHHVLMMINYDAIFFSQGVIDQLYFKAMMRQRNKMAKTVWAPLCIVVGILLYALSSPQNYSNTGFLFFYPLYSDYTIQCTYTTGTWVWIFFVAWLLHSIANKKFNERGYNLMNGGSMYAYLSHYFFIIVVAVTVIRPYQIPFVPALIIEMVLTSALILVSYLILEFIYDLAFPPKKKSAESLQDRAAAAEDEQRALLKNQDVTVEAHAKRE